MSDAREGLSLRALAWYAAMVLLLGWVLEGIAAYRVGLANPAVRPWFMAGMWSPTLVALGFLIFHPPARQGVRMGPGDLRFLPAGLLASIILAFGTVALALGLGWGRPGWFEFHPGGVTVSGGPWKLGLGAQSWPRFAGNILVTGAWFAALNCVVAVGEEFAWRGFMQGHLVRLFRVPWALVVLGLFWSLWHLPLLLAGYNYPDHPALGALVLFPLELVASSLFLGWLTLRSRSFWPAAFAHGATNGIEAGVLGNLRPSHGQLRLDLLHLGLTLGLGLLAWWLLRRSSRDRVVAASGSLSAGRNAAT
ncbi:MAG TPA: CPBP family intramembrane glutamic endopeptidase [Geothrix sp.]|nr:CPBP family intramembrane glutamic endopeptidase [Geothrix sp.]